ncbi:MAG: penicillin-binding transpeptidase domain-containing protein [Eubacteriales bacterium]|nr:penicillin-binding transpeptidase domain-containing protein [Eubacteriales bacterium]MDD3199048.1 penicillin-binding transpeptidase domain-containing protein [Eubacteriales bacterium]MDD4629466.1 penicillin-binding transpeptidase domain-containing protein [Eubacteriales bacterium]
MSPTTNKNKRRLVFLFVISCLLCTALAFRVGWIQVVASEKYAKIAVEQQTRDVPIPAKRGIIYDRNGKELAISAVTSSIWARPGVVKNAATDEESAIKQEQTASKLAEILGMDKNAILETISQERSLVKVAKYVDKEKSDKIRAEGLRGIEIAEDVKRYYPMGAFAAHLLGSTTDDNRGLAGIELKYDKYLSGIPGRWIKNTDRDGDSLSYGVEKYFQAENGLNLVLTIDEVIQHYVEKALDTVMVNTQSDRVMCIVMDPKTGDILAMATTPDYDPNNSRVPLTSGGAAYVESLSDKDKLNYWNAMWRNPLISDTYEPGSTFKLLTTSIALEEGVTHLDDKFVCTGSIVVAGEKLKCWRFYNPHGAQNLVEAVGNSCNPVFVQLAQRTGYETYFDYLELFGLREKTGIDYPGEGYAILQPEETAGPVGLATMSYGQGIAVTPIQLITAVSALGNEGKLMQPRIVKELSDSDGNVIQRFDTKVVRNVVSKETADEMCLIMEAVVGEGGGGTAKIPGYRIGGKTGTANKVKNGVYTSETYSSFIGMAPMDDPRIAILLIVDNPKGVKFGSQTAAPGVKLILEETLRYLNIQPGYSEEELQKMQTEQTEVPDVTSINFSDAIGILGGASLNYTITPATDSGEDFIIVDQYPKPGEKMQKGGTVCLYKN